MTDNLTPAEQRERIAQWEALERHPAWALLDEHLAEREDRAVRAIARGGIDLEAYARLGAEIDLCRRVRLYPTDQAAEIAASLPMEDPE